MSDQQQLRNFVNGEYVDPVDGGYADLIDPCTGEVFAQAPVSGAADVDAAMKAAATAFESWRDTTPAERQRALLKLADAVEARAAELVDAEVRNTGKPRQLTADEELPPAVDEFRFFAGAARMLEGRSAGEYMAGHTSYVRREPIGVCAQVTPWNYPLMMAVWKIAPALAAGNTVVLKPSDTTPVSTLLLAEIAAEFFPPGVFNVVCGDRDTGRTLVSHPTPQLVSITGSTRAGMEVAAAAAPDLKRTHLELGGKAPVVIFDDADIAAAAEAIAVGGYFNAGQDCTAATRVLAGPGIHDDFVAALTEQARNTRTGAPDDADVLYGPLNNANQLARVTRLRGPAARPRERRAPAAPGRRARLLLRPDGGLRRAADRRDHPGRGVRAGHHRAAVLRRGRGGALGQRRGLRPVRLGLDPRPRPGHADDPPARLRLRLGEHPHPVRLGDAARRLQALRPRQGPVGLQP